MPAIRQALTFTPSPNLDRLRELTATMTDAEIEISLFFDLSNDLFAVANKEGYFLRVNKQWTKALGWTERELLSMPFYNFIHPDDVERTARTVAAMNGKPITRFVNRYRGRDGSYHTLEWTASKMHNGRTYAVARDITAICQECPVDRSCPHLKDAPHAADERRRSGTGPVSGTGT